ncbi:MAG: peptide-methionine (S)-S-oxide reductase MsrA [Rhizobiaceae bacterium]|nr:peptide-methionine (S)-S-oxide reductase MsrA [Rhizobiaceae bacterium]
MPNVATPFSRRFVLATLVAAAALPFVAVSGQSQAREGIAIPPPVRDVQSSGQVATAVVAGGCFWGVQGVFQHVDGVKNAVSGYAGDGETNATYDLVSAHATRHAESVKVTYDPARISYGQILQIFFSVAHDPTQLDRQGPDKGTQYRSAIFPQDAAQAEVAQAYIDQLDAAKVYERKIVTRIEPGHPFFAAEDYHQDFMAKNPDYPYIVYNDLPKVENLKRLFPDRYRTEPVLVSMAQSGN